MQKALLYTSLTVLLFLVCAPAWAQQSQQGDASYYNDKYQGRKTASGELYDRNKYTAAHRTLPFGALVQVTNLANNKAVIVKINDMGPSKESRIIDLSYAAADAVGLIRAGVARMQVDLLEEYPTASSPYAVGPVIGLGNANPSPAPKSTTAATQRIAPAASPSLAATSNNDMVLPNIRPAGTVSTPTSTPPASNLRTSEAPVTTAAANTSSTKGVGLFKFYAQRVTAEGYGVQVGAFSDYTNVMEATATLSAQGIDDFLVKTTNVDGKYVFKLIVGPFNSRGAADAFKTKLNTIPGMGKGMVLSLAGLKP